MRKFHRNPNGHWCRCPWGPNNADPYSGPEDAEVVGSVTSMWHEAAKLEWLRGREDKKEGYQKFLDYLEQHVPEHDPLFPWMVREWRNDRLQPQRYQPSGQYQDALPFTYQKDNGGREGLESDDLDMLNRWMKYRKQNKQGVDIMKHEIGHVMPEASKWDAGGDEVWNSDDDPEYYGDGMKVVHLRNRRDLRVEGRRMNHCLGHSSQRYDLKQKSGENAYYSVRDHNNNSLGTLEMDRKIDHYYKCPGCGKFSPGEPEESPEGGYHRVCEHCNTPLSKSAYYRWDNPDPLEGVQTFPVDLNKMGKKPDSRFTQPSDFYGFEDGAVPHHAVEAMNQFLKQHGHSWHDSSAEDEEEEDPEPEDITDLGYSSTYSYPPPQTAEELLAHEDGEYEQEAAPQQWHEAVRAADNHGLEYPELEMDDQIDPQSIFDSLRPDNLDQLDPQQIAHVWQSMENQGMGHEFADTAHNWLKDEYEPHLDPYGADEGNAFQPGIENTLHVPRDPDNNGRPFAYPHLPAWHYPTNTPHEEYFARNLQHHLDQYIDPQTGEPMGDYERGLRYPPRPNPYQRGDAPDIPRRNPPIPEQTGPDQTPQSVGQYNQRQRNVLPYMRGEEPQYDPGSNRDQEQLFQAPIDYTVRRQRPRRVPYEPWMPAAPVNPSQPENVFTPGTETTQQQRAIPGMEWSNEAPSPYPWVQQDQMTEKPYDPFQFEHYDEGEQQGSLMPSNWYVNFAKKRAMETDLPPHLFPPTHFHHFNPQEVNPNQAQMWDQDMVTGRTGPQEGEPGYGAYQTPANINTQTELPYSNLNEIMAPSEEWVNRPYGEWRANVKESGEWTDYEDERKVKREDGWGPFHDSISPHHGERFHNGKIIRFAPDEGHPTYRMPGFEWRIPVLHHNPTGRLYVGLDGMEHGDLAKQFALPEPWTDGQEASPEINPGYIDLEGTVGGGGLHFFRDDPPDKDLFTDWVEDEYGVRSKKEKPDFESTDLWESSYHPRQDDEWADEEEPVFSATLPEGRWHEKIHR